MGNFPPYLLYPKSSPKSVCVWGRAPLQFYSSFVILIKKNVCCKKRGAFKTVFVFGESRYSTFLYTIGIMFYLTQQTILVACTCNLQCVIILRYISKNRQLDIKMFSFFNFFSFIIRFRIKKSMDVKKRLRD